MKTFLHINSPLALCMLFSFAHADTDIFSPIVIYGEREAEVNMTLERAQSAELELAMTPTERWWSQVSYEESKETGESSPQANQLEFTNILALTEQGEYPVDLGLVGRVDFALRKEDPHAATAGLLLSTAVQPLFFTVNGLLEKDFGTNANSAVVPSFAGEIDWRIQRFFVPGIATIVSTQQGDAGLQVKGSKPLGSVSLGYFASVLRALDHSSPPWTFSLELEYEWH